MKTKITKVLSSALLLLLLLASNYSNATIYCCHVWHTNGYQDPVWGGGTSSVTISGNNIYIQVDCYGGSPGSCPSCSPSHPYVNGNLATYDPADLNAYVFGQIHNGNPTGSMNWNSDPAVTLTWSVAENGDITVTYSGNDDE